MLLILLLRRQILYIILLTAIVDTDSVAVHTHIVYWKIIESF